MVRLHLPYDEGDLDRLEVGEEVLIDGVLHVGRDQVHRRLCDMIARGEEPPFDFTGHGIYYMGPSPAPQGHVIGAAGPTTSARMDPYSPTLVAHGPCMHTEAVGRCTAAS